MELIFWRALFGLIVAGLFFRSQFLSFVRRQLQEGRVSSLGFLFATGYALLSILIIDATFTTRPIPRFDDLFLAGIALAAYFFSTGAALYLSAIAILVSLWYLPPAGNFTVASLTDSLRILSFAAVSGILILVTRRLKTRKPIASSPVMGYLFATVFAIVGSIVNVFGFHAQAVPRFNDIFLVGIAVTAYFFSVPSAAYLLVLSAAISAWILPPNNSLLIATPADWYRLISFSAVAALLIFITARLKTWRSQTAALQGD